MPVLLARRDVDVAGVHPPDHAQPQAHAPGRGDDGVEGGGIGRGLAVDGDDDVTGFQGRGGAAAGGVGGRGAVGLDVLDDDALAAIAPDELLGERDDREAVETAGALALDDVVAVGDRDVDLHAAAGADDVEFGGGAGGREGDGVGEAGDGVDRTAVEMDHDVAGVEPGLGRGAVGLDAVDNDAAVPGVADGLGVLGCERGHGDADAAAVYAPVAAEVVHDD